MNLPYQLERTVRIHARPETVFSFFTDSARWAKWWGTGSTIDAQPGGKVYIRHPNGIESSGEVLEVAPPERIVFTYGFNSGKPMPPGSSRVTIRLEPGEYDTRLDLVHEFAEEAPRDQHVQGWRFQLSLFSNAVCNEAYLGSGGAVDGWYAAWSVADEAKRAQALEKVAVPEIQFRDRYSALEGIDDLVAHVGASQRFMPGLELQRRGDVRHCQGRVLADWAAVDREGKEQVTGTSVITLALDGRIESVVSFAK
jgi:uncharacterized protein YndB with AHSA1/START domain